MLRKFLILFILSSTIASAEELKEEVATEEVVIEENEDFINMDDIDSLFNKTTEENIISEEENKEEKSENKKKYVDFSVLDTIRARHEEDLLKFTEPEYVKKLPYSQRQAVKVQREDILKSGTYVGTVKRHAILVNVNDNSTQYIPKNIAVKAYRLKDQNGYRYLENRDGTITFKIQASEISNIAETVKMHEKPFEFVREVKEEKIKFYDDHLDSFIQYNFHAALSEPEYTKDLVNDESGNYALISRHELAAYARWEFPFQAGVTASYESFDMRLDNQGKARGSFIAMGPAIKTHKLPFINTELHYFMNYQVGILSTLRENRQTGSTDYQFNQNSFLIGVEQQKDTSFGKFIYGFTFQRRWLKSKNTQYKLDLDTDSAQDDSFGFFIGMGADKKWLN